ncbi:MAG TPA: MlaD family protein [Vicinamibacterales bacterium]|nr:MlaD family protein [Vicinamibacterales bacterium]
MPRTRSLAWSQLKIGVIAIAAVVLAVMLILAVGGQGGFPWDRYELKTKFPNVKGLKSSALVRIAGVDVGKVTSVDFAGAEVQVTLEVNKDNAARITEQSRASIGSLSLLGEPIIEISPSSEGRTLKDGDFIQGTAMGGDFAAMSSSATATLDQVNQVLQGIRKGEGTVGKLFTDEQMYREFNALLASADGVIAGVNRGQGTLGKLAKDDAAYRQLTASLADLNAITRRIKAGEGSLGQLLNDDKLAKSITSASGNIDAITGKLSRGEGTAGKLLNDKALYDRVTSMTDRMDKLVAALEQGIKSKDGTAGLLLTDKKLYDNMNGAASEVRGLIAEIKKDPRKYLNVRVSIF